MKRLPLSTRNVWIEFGGSSLRVHDGTAGIEVPIQRLENGKIANRDELIGAIRSFAGNGWGMRPRAICAISARGVSLRRITLPPTTKDNFDQLLAFQVEKEFPLGPDELAWGCYAPNQNGHNSSHSGSPQEVTVIAVKKETVAEYADLLKPCELNPLFTVGVIAAAELCRQLHRSHALLDIGEIHSELICVEDGVPSGIRTIAWGYRMLRQCVADALNISPEAADPLVREATVAPAEDQRAQKVRQTVELAFARLAASIRQTWKGQHLYVTGTGTPQIGAAHLLSRLLGVTSEPIHIPHGEGTSAAILGLKSLGERNGACPPLVLDLRNAASVARKRRPMAQWKWAAIAAALVIALLCLRYAEAFIRHDSLSQRLAQVNAERERLPRIDRELAFLQFLETNQPPYLNALVILANASAPGTRIQSLSMNRRGDLSIRATMQNSQQATDLRSKLIESGLFSTVVFDEQTPGPNRQVNVRLSARWRLTKSVNLLEKTNTPALKPAALQPPTRTR